MPNNYEENENQTASATTTGTIEALSAANAAATAFIGFLLWWLLSILLLRHSYSILSGYTTHERIH